MEDSEHLRELIRKEKQEKLAALADPIRATGIEVSTKVLAGVTSEEIVREVLRDGDDLVLRVAKGKESRSRPFFGHTGIQLLKKCPCPVWLVSASATPTFKHVLACVNTTTFDPVEAELNDKVYELASSISQYGQGKLSVIQACWEIHGEQTIMQRRLDEFLEQHGDIRPDNASLIEGAPSHAVPKFVQANGVDLVVMGTRARSGVSGMVMGNTAEEIVNWLECSLLALKPSSFVCPISLD